MVNHCVIVMSTGIILLNLVSNGQSATGPIYKCPESDLFLLIDTSHSMLKDMKAIQTYVLKVVNLMNISSGEYEIGVLFYGSNGTRWRRLDFGEAESTEDLLEFINHSFQFTTKGRTQISEAFKEVQKMIGLRAKSAKDVLMIHITDGFTLNDAAAEKEAKKLRDKFRLTMLIATLNDEMKMETLMNFTDQDSAMIIKGPNFFEQTKQKLEPVVDCEKYLKRMKAKCEQFSFDTKHFIPKDTSKKCAPFKKLRKDRFADYMNLEMCQRDCLKTPKCVAVAYTSGYAKQNCYLYQERSVTNGGKCGLKRIYNLWSFYELKPECR